VAHGNVGDLHSNFFGLPHMFAVVKLLGSRSLPWLVRALLDFLSQKVWCHVYTRSLLYVHVETCIALSTVQVWETKEWPMSILNPLNCCF
jgi:hypothetical protein